MRRGALGIANGQHRDAAGGAEITFHQGRGERLDVSNVVEAVADRVGGKKRGDVDVEIEKVPDLARILGAIQALERAPPWIRIGRRGGVHARFERGDQLRELVRFGTSRACRRHHAGAQLVDHLFRELAIRIRTRDVPARERQIASLAAIVMATGAILLDELRLGGGAHACRVRRDRPHRRLGRLPGGQDRNREDHQEENERRTAHVVGV